MKANILLVSVSFVLLSLSSQALSWQSVSVPNPLTPNPSAPAPESESTERDLPPPTLPPRLSEAEIKTLQAALTQGIETWFSLAGLSKLVAPPPLSEPLQNYREAWSAVNADVATFLGSWHDSEGYPYSLSVFPSTTSGQVCVLEFKPEWSLYIFNEATGEYGKDMISEQILSLSIATAQDGHLRSRQVRSVGSATAVAKFTVGEAYPVSFMGLMDDQGTARVVALASLPTLPATLPNDLVAPVSQTLFDYGCITDLTLPSK